MITKAAEMLKRESEKPLAERKDEWWVYSTALNQGWLMLYNPKSGLTGTVRDPSRSEWRNAFHAPSKPYVWPDADRVVVDSGRN